MDGEQSRLISEQGFKKALVHMLTLSLVVPARRSDLAMHVKYGRITRNINTDARFISRAFQFFDTDNERVLDLAHFATGVAKLSSTVASDQAELLFFLTDLNNDQVLSLGEVSQFTLEFVEFFCKLVQNTLDAEHQALVDSGYSSKHIINQLATVQAFLDDIDSVVSEQVAETFKLLDLNEDKAVSRDEWMGQVNAMPKFYNKLRNMCVAVLAEQPVFLFAQLEGQSSIAALEQLKGLGIEDKSALVRLAAEEGLTSHAVQVVVDLYQHFGSKDMSSHFPGLSEKGFYKAILMGLALGFIGPAVAEPEERSNAIKASSMLLAGIDVDSGSNLLARAFAQCAGTSVKAISLTQFGSFYAKVASEMDSTGQQTMIAKILGWQQGAIVGRQPARQAVGNVTECQKMLVQLWSNALRYGYNEASLAQGLTPTTMHMRIAALRHSVKNSVESHMAQLSTGGFIHGDKGVLFRDYQSCEGAVFEQLGRAFCNSLSGCDSLVVDTSCIAGEGCPELFDVDLTLEQKTCLQELFAHHAEDKVLRVDSFNMLLVEAFSYSLLRHRTLDTEAVTWLRAQISSGAMLSELDFTSPLFYRSWEWFDEDAKGFVDLADLGSKISAISSTDNAASSKFLFFLSDLNDNGSISEEEMLAVYKHFFELYGTLSKNILQCDGQRLVESGMPSSELDQRLKYIADSTQEIEESMFSEMLSAFEVLDRNRDRRIDYNEWSSARSELPKVYNKLQVMVEGMLRNTERTSSSCTQNHPITITVKARQIVLGMGFSDEDTATIVDMWMNYSDSGRVMSDHSFYELLVEGFARAFCSSQDQSLPHALRYAAKSGALTDGLDLSISIFWRTFEFFDKRSDGALDLQAFATGIRTVVLSSPEERMDFIFFLIDQDNNGYLDEAEVLKVMKEFSVLFAQLAINVVKTETPLLISQGVSYPAVHSMLDFLEQKLIDANGHAVKQFEETFGALDRDHDNQISVDEWNTWQHCLPECYAHLKLMFGGIIRKLDDSVIHFDKLTPVCLDTLAAAYNLSLSEEELARAVDLFDAHSGPTGMEQEDFDKFLLEVLGYSFLCRRRSPAALRHLRKCALDGRLTVPDDDVGFFKRAWNYFSPAGRALSLEEFARGLARTCSTDVDMRRQFLFYMISTDSANITTSVMREFLMRLVLMRGAIQIQVVHAERPFLMHMGVPGGAITRQTAQVAEMMLSASELVEEQVDDVIRLLDADYDNAVSANELSQAVELPAILALFDQMLVAVLHDIPREPSPLLSGNDAPGSALALVGLGLSQSEMLRISDLFAAHSVDGLMDRRRFDDMILEGLAYSFISRSHDDSCRMYLRLCIANGKLRRGVDTSSPIFWRSFEYFDADGNQAITLRELGSGMARAYKGEPAARASYLHFITDINNNGELTYDEVIEFFRYFAELFAALGSNTLSVERPHLLRQGVAPEVLDRQIDNMKTQLLCSDAYIQETTRQTFADFDKNRDARINHDEWVNNVDKLPKLYMKLSNMFSSIMQCEAPVFPQIEQELVNHELMTPELRGLGLTQQRASTVLDLWETYSTSNQMSPAQLNACLCECFARHFVSSFSACTMEAEEALITHQLVTLRDGQWAELREWSCSGSLSKGFDPASMALLGRIWQFFDTHHVRKLDLRSFGIGISKICSSKFTTIAQFLFFLTDTSGTGLLGQDSLETFTTSLTKLRLQLHLNLLEVATTDLLKQGMEQHMVQQATQVLSERLKNVQQVAEETVVEMCKLLGRDNADSITFGEFMHEGAVFSRLPAVYQEIHLMCKHVLRDVRNGVPSSYEMYV